MKDEILNKFFNLKELREKFGLNQKQMADMLFIHVATYKGYELGTHLMPRPMFELLKYKVFELHFKLTELEYRKYADSFKS